MEKIKGNRVISMNKKNINLGIWCLTFNCLLIKIFIGFSNILLHETGSSSCLALIFSFAVFTAILFIVYFFKRYFILSLKNTYLRNTIFVIFIGYLISHNIYFILTKPLLVLQLLVLFLFQLQILFVF